MQKETEIKARILGERVEAVKIHWILYSSAQRLPAIPGIRPGSTFSAVWPEVSSSASLGLTYLNSKRRGNSM